MSVFQSILNGLQKEFNEKQSKYDALALICTKVLGMSIDSSQIKVVNGKLLLNLPPTAKMALKLKMNLLLEKIVAHDTSIHSIS